MGFKKLIDLDLLDRFLTGVKALIPSKTSDLTNDAGFITGMTILSYGSSTWQNFLDAYSANKVVYCRASSNSDPAIGEQLRLAFLAYVAGTASTPTSVEFQYYRSVSSHSDAQQGDQVYIYKLTNAGVWSVTVREAYTKIDVGTGLSKSYSNGTLTMSSTGGGGSNPIVYTSTIPTTGWTAGADGGVYQNISFSGVTFTSGEPILIDLNISTDAEADGLLDAWKALMRATPVDNSSNIRILMSEAPSIALPVRIVKF